MINYSSGAITISDEANPDRPPLTLPPSATPAEVDAALQAYLPPPPPEPDWDRFREGLRTENGYQNYFAQAAQQRLLTAASLPVEFFEFRKTGNHASFLSLFVDLVSRLSQQDAANALYELIELSQRCHMPQAFINDLVQLAQPPTT